MHRKKIDNIGFVVQPLPLEFPTNSLKNLILAAATKGRSIYDFLFCETVAHRVFVARSGIFVIAELLVLALARICPDKKTTR